MKRNRGQDPHQIGTGAALLRHRHGTQRSRSSPSPPRPKVWVYVTCYLLRTAYTVVNIPLDAIVPQLSADLNERSILVPTHMICAPPGASIVMSITTLFVKPVSSIVDPFMKEKIRTLFKGNC